MGSKLEKAKEQDHSRLVRLENMFKRFDKGNDCTKEGARSSMADQFIGFAS